MRKLPVVAIVTLVLLSSCTKSGPSDSASASAGKVAPPIVFAASLVRYDACGPLLNQLKDEALKRVGPYGLQTGGYQTMEMKTATGAAAPMAAGAADTAQRSAADTDGAHTTTNVQEEGVDEPDSVKTDGSTIFAVRSDQNTGKDHLVAVSVDGLKQLSSIDLPNTGGYELLQGDKQLLAITTAAYGIAFEGRAVAPPVAVAPAPGVAVDDAAPNTSSSGSSAGSSGSAEGGAPTEVAPSEPEKIAPGEPVPTEPSVPQVYVVVIDISDPAKMHITDTVKLDGTYAAARMVHGVARVVVNTAQNRIAFATPAVGGAAAENAALARNKQIVNKATIADFMPHYEVDDAAGKTTAQGQLSNCAETYSPKQFSGFDSTNVVTIDPAHPAPQNSATIVGSAGTVYASTSNLYVATVNWPEPTPVPLGKGVVGTKPVAPDTAVAPDEPVSSQPQSPAKTSLHRFDITDPSKAVYAASGEIRGTLLNQWSMSEDDGFFRVASTEDNFTSDGKNDSSSFVTVLDAKAAKLNQVGIVSGMGKGERIYGVRFLGKTGYVVTFRQFDPLHVVDLSDPKAPKVTGELEIPGYSAYLHPVGDGLLLGVGATIKDNEPYGTLLSLFDVSDPAHPTRLAKAEVPQTQTFVTSDHHAFTWWPARHLAVVPIQSILYEPDKATSFAVSYTVADGKITEVGRTSHHAHAGPQRQEMLTRSLVVGDTLFTISDIGIAADDITNMQEKAYVAL